MSRLQRDGYPNGRVSWKVEIFERFWSNEMDTPPLGYPSRYTKSTQKSQHFTIALPPPLGYPSRYTKSTQKSQLFTRAPPPLAIHLVTPKALKNLNFSRYLPTWVPISLHRKHSEISTFYDAPPPRGYPSRYTKSTQKSQLFTRAPPPPLAIHLVTPKALKNLNFSRYLPTWVPISLHRKHSEISTFYDAPPPRGYPSRYTKSTQKSQLFTRAPPHWLSISLHQKHSKISTFHDTSPRGYPSRYTESTQKSQLFTMLPPHVGIHLVTPKALRNLNFLRYPPPTWVSISLHEKHSKISAFHDTPPLEFSVPERRIFWHLFVLCQSFDQNSSVKDFLSVCWKEKC